MTQSVGKPKVLNNRTVLDLHVCVWQFGDSRHGKTHDVQGRVHVNHLVNGEKVQSATTKAMKQMEIQYLTQQLDKETPRQQ